MMSSAILNFDVERVFYYLCSYWDDFRKAPPEEEMGSALNLSQRLLKDALAQLEDAGRLHPGILMPTGTNGTDHAGIPF
jgi:hypothetical protein